MRGAILYGPRDVRFEEREVPKIIKPTDAVIRISAACVCGSDLWPFRGIQSIAQPTPMGHEYCGIVEEIGNAVKSVRPGQFVIGSFFASDNVCPTCQIGYQSSCQHREIVGGAQASLLRVPLADGTLVATTNVPAEDLIPSLLTLSDVMGTGWFAADAANVKPGSTVAVVGDGALYVRAYNGPNSRWFKAAMQQKAGRIIAVGATREVTFEPVNGKINDLIDDAYRPKYKGSPYLSPMIGERARAATVKVMPRESKK